MLIRYQHSSVNGRGAAAWTTYQCEEHLESVFDQLAGRCGETVARNVRLIIGRNLRSGRAGTVLAQTKNITLADYVWRVAAHYQNPGPFLVDRPPGHEFSRQPLFGALQEWAYNRHLCQGFTAGEAWQRAIGCARRTLLLIAHRPFSYDVAFDAWAITLLQQICTLEHTAISRQPSKAL
jgi:hypothetical protein